MLFQAKQVVWAKIDKFPWWPALITKAPKSASQDYRINFFAQKHYAYVSEGNLAKYKEMYNQYARPKSKNHVLEQGIKEADNYLKEKKGLRKAESTSEVETVGKKGKESCKLKHSVSQVQIPTVVQPPPPAQIKRRESEIHLPEPIPVIPPSAPLLPNCDILEVDFKKLNQVQDSWRSIYQTFIQNIDKPSTIKQTVSAVKTFDISTLNDQQLSRTKITNTLKYYQKISKQSKDKESQSYFSKTYEKLSSRVRRYLSSTNYYEQFFLVKEEEVQEEVQEEEEEQGEEKESVVSTDHFEDKVFELLKRNYHFKKDNAKVLAERIGSYLDDMMAKKKCQIIRDLKVKELKPGRREHINEEEIHCHIAKIMSDL